MKIVILGTSEFDIFCSNAIIDSGSQVVAMISIPQKAPPNNSADISLYAKQNDIPYYELEDINSLESLNLLRNYAPDYILVSWPSGAVGGRRSVRLSALSTCRARALPGVTPERIWSWT